VSTNETPHETSALPPLVLVAEDSAVNRRLLELLLTELGYQVHVVAGGRDAVRAVKEIEYAAVLMDCQMPDLDGFAATAAIRAHEGTTLGRTPVIALTAADAPGDREACFAAGMDDFLPKPIDREQLRVALERWTGAPPSRLRPAAAGPAFDQAETLAQFGNSVDLLVEIVAVFLAESPALRAALRGAAAAGDTAALERAAHKLAGALGNFRAVAAFDATRHLEHLARAGTVTAVPAALAAVEHELDRLLPELRALRPPS